MPVELPPDLCPLESQVAGHTFDTIFSTFGMLRNNQGDSVFKPLGKPHCAEREISFYTNIQNTDDEETVKLKKFIPQYKGHSKKLVFEKERLFVQLENVTIGMDKPCVMDIKIGKVTWDPLATEEKKSVETEKYAECKNSFGICIPGFQVYNSEGKCLKFGKDYGKQLNQKTLIDTIRMFLSIQNNIYKPLVKSIISYLCQFLEWFVSQKSFNFYSSSILIAYDHEMLLKALKEKTSEDRATFKIFRKGFTNQINAQYVPWVKVKMIDFAHVFNTEGETHDTNYLFGLQNLIYILQKILIECR